MNKKVEQNFSNMRSIITLKFLLIACFVCTSCSKYISYTVPTPPKIEIQNIPCRIGFINQYDYTNLPFDNDDKKKVYIDAIKQLLTSLETSFMEDESFKFLFLDSLKKGQAPTNFPAQMNADYVVFFCDSSNIDLLLTLDFFHPDFLIETEVEEDDDGSKSRTNIVDLEVRAGFTLYDKSGTLIYRDKSYRSMHYQSRPALVSFVAIGPSMGKAGKEVNTLSKEIGESYIQNFYPGNKKETAKIYTGEAFKKVEAYMNNDNWKEAIELLLPMANSTDSKISKKASHNLSIAYKASGNDSAYEYWKKK